jgi:hypothetical protein
MCLQKTPFQNPCNSKSIANAIRNSGKLKGIRKAGIAKGPSSSPPSSSLPSASAQQKKIRRRRRRRGISLDPGKQRS